MSTVVQPKGEQRRFYFVDGAQCDGAPWMRFKDPAPACAVTTVVPGAAERHAPLDVLIVGPGEASYLPAPATLPADDEPTAVIHVRIRGVEVWWRPREVVLQCDPDQVEALLAAIVDFSFQERELSALEAEIEHSWADLEGDRRLVFDVSAADLRNDSAVGARTADTFGRRIRFARMERNLYEPGRALPALAQKLGEELRERAGLEGRAEMLDGRLEVFEHIYEMASQRLGEYRAAHQAHRVEMIIIWLLALEAVLMLFQSLVRGRFWPG